MFPENRINLHKVQGFLESIKFSNRIIFTLLEFLFKFFLNTVLSKPCYKEQYRIFSLTSFYCDNRWLALRDSSAGITTILF